MVKTATGPKKLIIRRKILKSRVIKGGKRFVTTYINRCHSRINRWREQIKKNPAQSAILTKKIVS
jgi:hypothetical protein